MMILCPPNPLLGEDGLVAGGDLHPERLIHAYKHGIFPWYGHKGLFYGMHQIHVMLSQRITSIFRKAREFIAKSQWTVRINTSFDTVIQHCASIPRKGQEGTWIHPEMIEATVNCMQWLCNLLRYGKTMT